MPSASASEYRLRFLVGYLAASWRGRSSNPQENFLRGRILNQNLCQRNKVEKSSIQALTVVLLNPRLEKFKFLERPKDMRLMPPTSAKQFVIGVPPTHAS